MTNSFLIGVNLAGAEFAPHVPGVFGTDYTTLRMPKLTTMRPKDST